MQFRLYYRGKLSANGGREEKFHLRRAFHHQLKMLWTQSPLAGHTEFLAHPPKVITVDPPNTWPSVIYQLNGFDFACLVTEKLGLHAELDVLFLRSEPPGNIIRTGGDIDNRLKTLFDGLRRPEHENEFPRDFALQPDEKPFHCLFSDDGLITSVSATTDRLLSYTDNDEVVVIIHVTIRGKELTWSNLDLIG